MRFRGVRVDVQKAHTMKQELAQQENKLIQEVKKATGIDTQIWAARSIAQVFDKLKLDYDRTEKTQAPSFTKNFLQNHHHPLVKKIAQAREINKALIRGPRSLFLAGICCKFGFEYENLPVTVPPLSERN